MSQTACDHCYALRLAGRLKAMGQPKYQADGNPITFTLPEPKTSTADARAHLRRLVAQWAAAGREFSPRDFYTAAAEFGRGDAWVRREFGTLQDEKLIHRLDHGVYRALEAALA